MMLRVAESVFELEESLPEGEVPERVIDELRSLRLTANDAIADYRAAVKVQAEKHGLKPSALRRFVNALATDKLDNVGEECRQVVGLIDGEKE